MEEKIADGRTDLVFELVEAGAAPDSEIRSYPLIRWCSYYGDVSGIRYLLSKGVELEALGEDLGLVGAAFHGHWRLCQFLLENGADANVSEGESGETPLHAALCKANQPVFEYVVEVLLAAGADPNRATKAGVETGGFMRDVRTRGETPLHRAAAFGSERTIGLLLQAGADVEARDANGDSPLTWASWYNRPAHILERLCFGPHRIHPVRVKESREVRAAGWRGMERDLAGRVHV